MSAPEFIANATGRTVEVDCPAKCEHGKPCTSDGLHSVFHAAVEREDMEAHTWATSLDGGPYACTVEPIEGYDDGCCHDGCCDDEEDE